MSGCARFHQAALAVAVLHGSFNAAGSLSAVDGAWQYLPALLVLTLVAAAHRARG